MIHVCPCASVSQFNLVFVGSVVGFMSSTNDGMCEDGRRMDSYKTDSVDWRNSLIEDDVLIMLPF
jgi:hypothetical protein